MKNKLTIIFILVALIAVASLVFKFSSPFGKGGLRGIYKSEAAVSRQGLTLDLNFGNNNAAAAPTVYDTSGFNRHATSTAGATSPTCNNKFCDFDGSAGIMTANATNVFNSTNISWAIKFSPDFAPNDGVSHWIFEGYDSANSGGGYGLLKYSDNTLYVRVGSIQITAAALATYSPYWKVGKENVFIFSGTTANNNLWLNGIKILSGNSSAWTILNPSNLMIAKFPTVTGLFDGKIHYLKVWNRLLTDAEVANLSADRTDFVQAPSRTASSTNTSSVRGLVGYWTMDTNDMSPTGATMFDKSGQNNTGTVTGTTTSTGRIGQARTFNGTSDVITVADANSLDVNSFTASAWVKPSALAGPGQSYIVSKWNTEGNNTFLWDFNGANLRLILSQDGTNNASINQVTASTLVGQWIFVTVVYNATAQTVTFYSNGIVAPSSLISGAVPTSIKSGTSIVTISKAGSGLSGSLDDVRIYNYALSAQEVANLYSSAKVNYISAPPRTGLVGYWTMDTNDMSPTGATMYDKSGFNNNGTVTGTTTSTGKIGQARSFNGVATDLVNMGDILDSTFAGSGKIFTVGAWVKFSNANSNGILEKIDGVSDGFYFKRLGTANNRVLQGLVDKTSVSQYNRALGSTPLFENIWYYVVFQWNSDAAANARIKMYVNGVAESLTYQNSNNITISDTVSSLKIGKAGEFFTGSIDDVRIYNRALSAQEVAQLYASAKINYIK